MTTEQTISTEPTTTTAPAKPKLYGTRAEADAAKPANAPKRIKLFEVLQHGKSLGFIWTDGHAGAIVVAAREAGYTATLADKKGGGFFTREMLAGRVAALRDEELAEMGLVRGSKLPNRNGKKWQSAALTIKPGGGNPHRAFAVECRSAPSCLRRR
jgi:hypothetical protein